MDGQSDVFSELFVQSLESNTRSSEVEIEVLVDKLLKLDYSKRIFAITARISGEILCHLALRTQLLKTKNEFLMNKFFQLIVHLTSSQEIILDKNDVNNLLSKLKDVWMQCMNNATSLQALLDAVAAISYFNGPYISSEIMSFLLRSAEGSLIQIAKSDSANTDIRRTAVQCLTGFCTVCENGDHIGEDDMTVCLNLFISLLQSIQIHPPYDITMCRMVFALFKGIHNVLTSDSNSHLSAIGPLLAILKKFMMYGLPGLSHSAPHDLQPMPVPELRPAKRHDEEKADEMPKKTPAANRVSSQAKKKKRKLKSKFKDTTSENSTIPNTSAPMAPDQIQLRPAWARVTSSESEYSDTEGAQRAKLHSFLSKIRQMCLNTLLLTVKKTDKHTILGYWSSFLPEPGAATDTASLFTSFKQDSAPKCRAAALGVVGTMLEGSQWYLSLAAEETGASALQLTPSFVPFSMSLAASIREIHRQLLSASSKEQSTMALIQLLKTLVILVTNTPYQKMRPGLLIKVSSQARYFLVKSRDNNLKAASLALLSSVVTTCAPLGEVANILTDVTQMTVSTPKTSGPHTPVECRNNSESSSRSSSWLIDMCILFCGIQRTQAPGNSQSVKHIQPETPNVIKTEALVTLARTVKGYLAVVMEYVDILGDVICLCLEDSSPHIRIKAGSLLEELGISLLRIMKSSPSESLEIQTLALWRKLLVGPLQSSMQDHNNPLVQAQGCTCLSTMSPVIFAKLPKSMQIMCLTLLLGFTSDENVPVQAAAVRALGVYVTFPFLREDAAFLEDVAAAVIRLLDDSLLLVRANAAWSLGNLTDSFVINQSIRPNFSSELQSSLLLRIFNSAINSIDDKAKVVFNVMRVLGNLLRYLDESHIGDPQFQPVLSKSTLILSDMVGGDTMAKVRWNACTACSNLLSNPRLLVTLDFTDSIFAALCSSLSTCKNFKVRIKAASALSTPTEKEHYGDRFEHVFSSVVNGFEDSEITTDFAEFKFRDTLLEQLCTTFIHLSSLLTTEDLPQICDILDGKTECVQQQLNKYHDKLITSVENGPGDHSRTRMPICDPVEEYIVIKQMSTEEKLQKLNTVIEYVSNLTEAFSKGDCTACAKGHSNFDDLDKIFSALQFAD